MIYRLKKKQKAVPITLSDGERTWSLGPNTLVSIVMEDITDYRLCAGSNCRRFGGSLIRPNYLEASLEEGASGPSLHYAPQEVGAYNVNRIDYLMKKEKKKSAK